MDEDKRWEKWEELRRIAEGAFAASVVSAVKAYDNAAVAEVAAWFDTRWIVDDFYRNVVRHIFKLGQKGIPATAYAIASRLLIAKRFSKVTWPAFADWYLQAVGHNDLRYYACEVYDLHRRRSLASEASVAGDLLRTGVELDTVIEGFTNYSTKYAPAPAMRGKRNEDAFAQLIAEMEGKSVSRIDTGLGPVDYVLGGLEPGNVLVIGARPSCGKSAMLGHIAAHVANTLELGVLVFSFEMSTKEIYARWSSWLAEVPKSERRGFLEGMARLKVLEKKGLLHVFTGDHTVAAIERAAKSYVKQLPIGMLVVDYLQLVTPTSSTRDDTRERQVSDISRRLKAMALSMNIVVATASQLKREGSEKPTLSHLRECFSAGTTVVKDSGEQILIEQVKKGDMIESFNEATHTTCFSRVVDVWKTGNRQVFRVTTNANRQLTVTCNHPLLTECGWSRAEDIQSGWLIAAPYRRQEPEFYTTAPELCRLIGYLVGNGTYQKHRSAGIILPDRDSFEDASEIVLSHWPILHAHVRSEKYHDVTFTMPTTGGNRNPLIQWLKEIGMHGQRDCTKRLPACAFMGPPEEVIAGYFAADGCVTKAGGRWSVRMDSTSIGLLRDMLVLLNRIGVAGRIGGGFSSKLATKDIYRLEVCGTPSNLRLFATTVPVRGYRGRKLTEMLGELPENDRTGYDSFALPNGVSECLAACTSWRDQGKTVSRRVVRAMAPEGHWLRAIAESDVLWEKVLSVEPAGMADVYDIQIDGTHTVIADGIVAHNSGAIEQDADKVILLHPQDDASISKLHVIVAKNRNGQTGVRTLQWHKSRFRFYEEATESQKEF